VLAYLKQPVAFDRFLRQLRSKNWVVYAKRPFGRPEHVIQYLARYTIASLFPTDDWLK
jgi:hypothetical protein